MEEAVSLLTSGLCSSARIARHEIFSVFVVVVVVFVFDNVVYAIILFVIFVVVGLPLKCRCFRALVKMVKCASARWRGTTCAVLALISLQRLLERFALHMFDCFCISFTS